MSGLLDEAPYAARDEARFLEEAEALTRMHLAGCEDYARIWRGYAGAATVAELPWLHVGVFKEIVLRTRAPGVTHQRMLLSSATTSGMSSQVALDDKSGALQARSSLAILKDFVGDGRRPLIVLDDARALRQRGQVAARVAAALSLVPLASTTTFALDGARPGFTDWSAIAAALRASSAADATGEASKDAAETERAGAATGDASKGAGAAERAGAATGDASTGAADADRAVEAAGEACKPAAADGGVLVYGFTWVLWQRWVKGDMPVGVRELLKTRRVHFVHSGGWKKLEREAVAPAVLERELLDGVGPGSAVVDFYGLVEQNGVVFPACAAGARHVPRWADVIVRDPWTFAPLPPGHVGLLQLVNVLAHGAPYHSVLTEDLGELLDGLCTCGRLGPRFRLVGRVPRAELRGCADV